MHAQDRDTSRTSRALLASLGTFALAPHRLAVRDVLGHRGPRPAAPLGREAPHRGDALADLPVAAAAGANPPPITPTATDTTTAAPLPDKTKEPGASTEPSGPGPDAASSSSSSDADAPARTSNSDASPYWTVVVPSVTGGAVLITLGIVYLVRRKAEHRGSDMGEPLEWTGLA
ncbi:hypothetical protein GGF31_000284 [Allomyces arbusculus]|nr:hypothetical protein GGF31_000284 [Allomyces arbusculus]